MTFSQGMQVSSYADLSVRGRHNINGNERGVDKTTTNLSIQWNHLSNDALPKVDSILIEFDYIRVFPYGKKLLLTTGSQCEPIALSMTIDVECYEQPMASFI